MTRVLSIFCDESGDFGKATPHSTHYALSFVFHNQSVSIKEPITHLNNFITNNETYSPSIHTYPLIRREQPYRYLDLSQRRHIFYALMSFMQHCDIKTKTFLIDKSSNTKYTLFDNLLNQVTTFITTNHTYFISFDKLIIYYDRGQKQVSSILSKTFVNNFAQVEFRTSHQNEHYLSQVADLICTLEMLDNKFPQLTKSELHFFESTRQLKRRLKSTLYTKRF